jgi:hypothetical protein
MIRVHLGDQAVVGPVRVTPCVVVASLGLGPERSLVLVPPLYALAGEVIHAEACADRLYVGRVALIQQPDALVTPDGGKCLARTGNLWPRLLILGWQRHGHRRGILPVMRGKMAGEEAVAWAVTWAPRNWCGCWPSGVIS